MAKKKVETNDTPNIIFIGKPVINAKGEKQQQEPFRAIAIGDNPVIEMPDEETQRGGFFSELADKIIATYPNHYKQLKIKN